MMTWRSSRTKSPDCRQRLGSNRQRRCFVTPRKDRAAARRLEKINPIERGNVRLNLSLDPERQAARVGVLRSGQLVQRLMVELQEDRPEDFLDVPEVDGPAQHVVQRCVQVQSQTEGVPVNAP